jgi:hypothetical protein
MITKEELLQKGISEEVADDIMSKLSNEDETENSLQALQKAVGGDDDSKKSKKKKDEDEDDDDEEYDKAYMKKYMKRYMKENEKDDKDEDDDSKKMKKAIEEVNLDADGAVVEMEDLKPFLNAQSEFNSKMAKAFEDISSKIEVIESRQANSYDLMQKAAKVQIEQANSLSEFMSQPQGRKGVVADIKMQKAVENTAEQSKIAYEVLMKAVRSGDAMAGQVISVFESHGKNINRLNEPQRAYINKLIANKEAK